MGKRPSLFGLFVSDKEKHFSQTWGQLYKTFYVRNLGMLAIS